MGSIALPGGKSLLSAEFYKSREIENLSFKKMNTRVSGGRKIKKIMPNIG